MSSRKRSMESDDGVSNTQNDSNTRGFYNFLCKYYARCGAYSQSSQIYRIKREKIQQSITLEIKDEEMISSVNHIHNIIHNAPIDGDDRTINNSFYIYCSKLLKDNEFKLLLWNIVQQRLMIIMPDVKPTDFEVVDEAFGRNGIVLMVDQTSGGGKVVERKLALKIQIIGAKVHECESGNCVSHNGYLLGDFLKEASTHFWASLNDVSIPLPFQGNDSLKSFAVLDALILGPGQKTRANLTLSLQIMNRGHTLLEDLELTGQYLKSGQFTEPQVQEKISCIIYSMLNRLHTMHSHGIIHNDIHIANLVRYQKQWYIIDFDMSNNEEDFEVEHLSQREMNTHQTLALWGIPRKSMTAPCVVQEPEYMKSRMQFSGIYAYRKDWFLMHVLHQYIEPHVQRELAEVLIRNISND